MLSHTTVELQQAGYDVVIVDNLSNSREDVLDGIEKITGIRPAFEKVDLRDFDATESVFAAVYLDGGITAASELIHRVLLDVEREEVVEERRRDYKTLLQEHIQRKAGQELTYCMVREEGPDHAKTFVTEVRLNGAAIGEGSGHSKKESEQMAAKSALEKLDNQ